MRNTIFFIGMAFFCLAFSGCRGWVTDQRPIHPNPNMDTQEKLKPYRKSDFFADGRAMRMPVEGTVGRTVAGNEPRDADLLALDPHRYEGSVNGNPSDQFPADFQGNAAKMKRGQQRYNIYCAPCHGQDGNGQGAVARRLSVKPPTFHQQRIWDLPVGSIFQTITHGKNVPNMPAYNTQLPVSDRWAVVYYLRAVMASQNTSLSLYPVAATPEPQADGGAVAPAEGVVQ